MPALQTLLAEKFFYNFIYIAMLAVDGIVQLTHVVIGYLSRQLIQRGSYAGMPAQHVLSHDRYSFVWRKVVPIVLQDKQIERGNQSIGGIPGSEIDLFVLERTRQKAKVHDAR